MDVIAGEHLLDLFISEKWRDHFEILADTLGFALSVYSEKGKPIFTTSKGAVPLCVSFQNQSADLASRCESYCHPYILKTLKTGAPSVFKCYAKIMSFAFPITYLNERAVVLGQGSFASYDDFRDCMDLVSASGIDMVTIKTPLSFTNSKQAWKACRFVLGTVNRLLENSQENVTLRKKLESLKSVFTQWGSSAAEEPQMRYQDMLYNLSTLLDLDHITILAHDRERGGYVGLYGLTRSGVQTAAVSLSSDDAVVRELRGGKPFVRMAAPSLANAGAVRLPAREASTFFPVVINGRLEGILRIAGRELPEGDRYIISGFCRQTALFIENHQLHQDLRHKFNRFAAIAELTGAIAPIQHYETLLRTILDKSAELLRAEQGSLMLLDRDTDALLLEAKKGVVEGVREKLLRINRGEGIAGKVALMGEAILVRDLENDPRINQKNRKHYKTHSFVSVPLKIDDRIIGVLNLSDKATGEVFDEEDLKLIQSFATHAAIVMERNEYQSKAEELKKLTITDSLTGLLNRRYLNERLKDEVARCERHGHNLSLLMLDLDGFKQCNDTHGHLVGDRMLKTIAENLLNTVRSMDVVARYGGDEFMIILPETEEPLAFEIAERIRSTIARKTAPGANLPEPPALMITASIGIVCYPKHGDTVELLLENVDQALYSAKRRGRNRIEVFS